MGARTVTQSDGPNARTGYEQTVDPFMKRMAVEKAVGVPAATSQGLIRRQISRPMEKRGDMYMEQSVMKGEEQVVYADQGYRVGVRPADRFHPLRYGQDQMVPRVAPRVVPTADGARAQPSSNSQRVYYVKNAVAAPSRVVLAPASMESYAHEEVVFDSDGYAIDGGEIPNNSGVYTSR